MISSRFCFIYLYFLYVMSLFAVLDLYLQYSIGNRNLGFYFGKSECVGCYGYHLAVLDFHTQNLFDKK